MSVRPFKISRNLSLSQTQRDSMTNRDYYVYYDLQQLIHSVLQYGKLNYEKELVLLQVVDTGPAFYGKGYSRIDICCRTEHDTFDDTINGPLTLVFR